MAWFLSNDSERMSNQQLIMIGAHQRTANLHTREHLAFGAEQLNQALLDLGKVVSEGCIISTCNRTEIYAIIEEPQADAFPLLHFLSQHCRVGIAELEQQTTILSGAAVVRHVCRLAAGLDSMVLGEDQIVGQIKAAMAQAQQAELLGQNLNKLFQHALATGKQVRTQTGIARSHLSVVSVALDLARQQFGSLADRVILIIGAGQTGELTLKHLSGETPARIWLANRSLPRAERLAESYRAAAVGLDAIATLLGQADVVLSATAAPDPVISASMAQAAMAARTTPLLLLDLAVPRDIDPAVDDIPGITRVDVDSMQVICEANRAVRAGEIARAEGLVEQAIGKYMEWWATRLATPTIRALRERAEAIRQAEVQRTLARLPQLSDRDQAAIHALSEAIINKLLHTPITSLKSAHTEELIGAAQQLFQIEQPHTLAHADKPGKPGKPGSAECLHCNPSCFHCPAPLAA
jgi:glutamyl-tRNA reductase